jgi:hypothetical protein
MESARQREDRRAAKQAAKAEAARDAWWAAQRKLPLHRRSRAWWIEEGSLWVMLALFVVIASIVLLTTT